MRETLAGIGVAVGTILALVAAPVQAAPTMKFLADSDAHIVKGLIGILMIIYNDKTAAEIIATPIEPIFATLGMEEHLSPNRRNGFFAMVEKIQAYARAAQS